MKTVQSKVHAYKFKTLISNANETGDLITDKELRESVGIKQDTLDNIFLGKANEATITKLVSYYGVSLRDFFGMKEGVKVEKPEDDEKPVNTLPTPVKPKKAKKRIATDAPSPFKVTEIMTDWFLDQNLTVDIQMQTRKFIDHHRSKGNKFVDWVAAWRNWMRKSQEYFNKDTSNTSNKKEMQQSLSNIHDTSWADSNPKTEKQKIKEALGNIHDFDW